MEKFMGYKAFEEENVDFKDNTLLSSSNSINKLGNTKFSFAERLEDSLKFHADPEKARPIIAEVTGIGNVKSIDSNYYEFYNIYVADDLRVDKILTPEEVIEYAMRLGSQRLERFVSLYKLNDDEIKKLKNKFLSADLALLYYQKQQLDIYKLYYESWYSNEKQEQVKQLINKL